MEKYKVFFENNKIWLYMAEYVLLAILLFFAALLIDMRVLPVIEHIPGVLLTSVDLGKSILSTLAGGLLTITTFTFSTIMVVLTTYASDYSPRVVENFLKQKSTMKILGVFVGGFVYCISSLFFMRNAFFDYRVLAPGIAILYSFWCIVQFIVFIFSVANSIQAQHLITGLYEEARDIIDTFVDTDALNRSDTYDADEFEKAETFEAETSGFLEIINGKEIQEVLTGEEYRMVVHSRFGDFVCEGQPLASLYHHADLSLTETERSRLSGAFVLETKRFTIRDYRFAIQKIVDIALRAISPGINDPNTAVSAIQMLGLLTGHLSRVDGVYAIDRYESSNGKRSEILIEDYNFKEDLYFTYYQIIHYGKKDISIVLALLGSLRGALLQTSNANRHHIREMAGYIYENAVSCYENAVDIGMIEREYRKITG